MNTVAYAFKSFLALIGLATFTIVCIILSPIIIVGLVYDNAISGDN